MTKLNDLDGKEWIKNTKSWFILRGKSRVPTVINHPAKYPEELAEKFINFFTHKNEVVFDPFMGVGSTGVAAKKLKRSCYGIEINNEFCKVANNRMASNNVILGDSRKYKNYKVSDVDFIITSPPYWDMLKKKRGHSDSQHNQRKEKKLKLYYSDNPDDLGNIQDYNIFLKELKKIFNNCSKILKSKKYMVVVIQNFRNTDGKYITFAWDLVKEIEKCGFSFEGEQIWCQDDKQLGIWGYPSTFISNIHHHYCLIFKKNA